MRRRKQRQKYRTVDRNMNGKGGRKREIQKGS
jgi:hypothetical protein